MERGKEYESVEAMQKELDEYPIQCPTASSRKD